jgi:alpha-1,2-mannosyltransferase
VAVAAFAAAVGLGFLVAPRDSAVYWSGMFLAAGRVSDAGNIGNQSLLGTITRLADSASLARTGWFMAAIALAGCGLALAAMASRTGPEPAGIVLCALTGLLISPRSWSHHWVWWLPVAVLAVHGLLGYRPLRKRYCLGWLGLLGVYALLFPWHVGMPRR